MNIFIDTNVFLSFYHLSSDDLEELKKLAVLAREGEVNLILPEQVIHEFRRNRENKIADAIKRLKAQRTSLQIPQMAKQYPEYEALRASYRESDQNLSGLIDQIERDAKNQSIEADAVIEELFEVALMVPRSNDLIANAKLRMDLGDPPGKKGSIGDAICWLGLLDTVPDGEDLFLISDDGDYFSELSKGELNPYLAREWSESKNSQLIPYDRISSLFRDHFPNIEISTELEKDLLIQQLSNSTSFNDTHSAIQKLSRFSDFTQSQVNAIFAAATSNDQIYWIANDPDIHDFIASTFSGREALVEPELLPKIRYFLENLEPFREFPLDF